MMGITVFMFPMILAAFSGFSLNVLTLGKMRIATGSNHFLLLTGKVQSGLQVITKGQLGTEIK